MENVLLLKSNNKSAKFSPSSLNQDWIQGLGNKKTHQCKFSDQILIKNERATKVASYMKNRCIDIITYFEGRLYFLFIVLTIIFVDLSDSYYK